MQKGWKLWAPRIQRSGPLNRSPRKPRRKSSRHRAHSPPAMTQHQQVRVPAGTHASPVHVRVCRHQMYDSVRQLKLIFPVTTLSLWHDKPPVALGFTVKRFKVEHCLHLLASSAASWDQKHIENALNVICGLIYSVCLCQRLHYIAFHHVYIYIYASDVPLLHMCGCYGIKIIHFAAS